MSEMLEMLGPNQPSEEAQTSNFTGNMIQGTVTLLIFALGTLSNIFSILYFISSKGYKTTTRFLYLSISVIDLIICLLFLPVSVSYYKGRKAGLFEWALFCNLWGVLWNVFMRMSVFMIAVLSVTRTLTLVQPLVPIRRRYVVGVTIFYFMAMIAQASIPFWKSVSYTFQGGFSQICGWAVIDVFGEGSLTTKIVTALLIQVELTAPMFPITICCFTTIIVLQLTNTANPNRKNKLKNTATITIILLTLNYIVFNLPMIIFLILVMIDQASGWKHGFFEFDYKETYLTNLLLVIAVGLNSLMNPVLYYMRLHKMREFAKAGLRRIKGSTSVRRISGVVTAGTLVFSSRGRDDVLSCESRDMIVAPSLVPPKNETITKC